jgi:hypothetical protein
VFLQEDRRSWSTLWVFLDVRGLLTPGRALGSLPPVKLVEAAMLLVFASPVTLRPVRLGLCWAPWAVILGFGVCVLLENGVVGVSVCSVCATCAPGDASRFRFWGFLSRAASLDAFSLDVLLLLVDVVDALTVT